MTDEPDQASDEPRRRSDPDSNSVFSVWVRGMRSLGYPSREAATDSPLELDQPAGSTRGFDQGIGSNRWRPRHVAAGEAAADVEPWREKRAGRST